MAVGRTPCSGSGFRKGVRVAEDAPVVAIGEVFEPRCMAVVGTRLTRFLRGWTGYYLMLLDSDPRALDVLEVPSSLRSQEPDDELMGRLLSWADPDLPYEDPDPYEKGLSADDLRRVFG